MRRRPLPIPSRGSEGRTRRPRARLLARPSRPVVGAPPRRAGRRRARRVCCCGDRRWGPGAADGVGARSAATDAAPQLPALRRRPAAAPRRDGGRRRRGTDGAAAVPAVGRGLHRGPRRPDAGECRGRSPRSASTPRPRCWTLRLLAGDADLLGDAHGRACWSPSPGDRDGFAASAARGDARTAGTSGSGPPPTCWSRS